MKIGFSKLIIVSLLLYFILLNFSFSQQLPYKNYNVEDGLSSSTVYYILQDSKGFMWFATESGVSRFDGSNFRNFTTKDGMVDNTVIGIFEDSKNRIWLVSLSGKICYFYNDKFFQLDTVMPFRNKIIQRVNEDKKGNIWLSNRDCGFIIIDEGWNTKWYACPEKSAIPTPNMDNNDTIWFSGFNVLYKGVLENDKIIFSTVPILEDFGSSGTGIYPLKSGGIVYTAGDKIVFLKNSIHQYLIPNHPFLSGKFIQGIYQDNTNALWIATNKGIISLSSDFLNNPQPEIYFENTNFSRVFQDKEGNYWFSTIGEGIYFLPSVSVLNYKITDGLSDNKINCIGTAQDGKIWLGLNNGKINLMEENKFKEMDALIQLNTAKRITCLLLHSDGSIWFGKDDGIFIIKNGKVKTINDINASGIKSLSEDIEGNVWAGNHAGFMKINNSDFQITTNDIGRVTAIYADKQNKIWLGMNDGLHTFSQSKLIYRGNKSPLLKQRIVYIRQSKDSTIWLATQGNGLVAMRGDSIFNFSTYNGFSSDICNSVFIDANNIIWAATNKGLSRIELIDNHLSDFKIFNYTTNHGLVSDEVNGITKQENKIFVATNKGLTVFEEDKIKPSSLPPSIYISRVRIMDIDTAIHNRYDLAYNRNNIKINFIGLSYKSVGKIRYKYNMNGIDTVWSYTSFPNVQYPKLPPGEYTFQVSAMNIDGYWSEHPATIQFTIHPPFWQMWWFWIFATMSFVGGTLAVSYWRIARIQRREKEKTAMNKKMAELEMTALRSQMNPHFIFNSLNSIQHLINANEKRTANDYLVKFAELLRSVLDYSSHSTISVENELKSLELYLDLEMLRFEDKFSYKFKIDKSIDIHNTEIPTFLIQPYIENCIKHGFNQKKSGGKITVELKKIKGAIVCAIEDNGIGRQKSAELKMQSGNTHTSKGMKITEERLSLLNKTNQNEMNVKILDLENEKGEARGTRVEIIIGKGLGYE